VTRPLAHGGRVEIRKDHRKDVIRTRKKRCVIPSNEGIQTAA